MYSMYSIVGLSSYQLFLYHLPLSSLLYLDSKRIWWPGERHLAGCMVLHVEFGGGIFFQGLELTLQLQWNEFLMLQHHHFVEQTTWLHHSTKQGPKHSVMSEFSVEDPLGWIRDCDPGLPQWMSKMKSTPLDVMKNFPRRVDAGNKKRNFVDTVVC